MSAGASATLFEVVSLETSIEFSESTTSSISRSLSYQGDGYATWSPE